VDLVSAQVVHFLAKKPLKNTSKHTNVIDKADGLIKEEYAHQSHCLKILS